MKTRNYLNILFLSIIYIILTPLKSLANPTIKPILNLSEYELEQSFPFNNNSYLPKNSTNLLSESEFLLSESTNNLETETKFKNLPQDTFDNRFENNIDYNLNNNFDKNNQPLAENNIKNNENKNSNNNEDNFQENESNKNNQCSVVDSINEDKKISYEDIKIEFKNTDKVITEKYKVIIQNYIRNKIALEVNKSSFNDDSEELEKQLENSLKENPLIEDVYIEWEKISEKETKLKVVTVEINETLYNKYYFIEKRRVVGNTVLTTEIEDKIKDFKAEKRKNVENEGQKFTIEELNNLAISITQLYLEKGYITSKAQLNLEEILDWENNEEVPIIQVIEGEIRYEDITVRKEDESGSKFKNYICQRIALGATKIPFNATSVEEQLRLLKTNPLFESVTARLKPSGEDGKTKLEIIVEEADPFFATFGFDNYSPPSIGDVQMVADLGYRGLTGLGDTFFVSYRPKVENFNTYNLDINYQVPLNPMAGSLQFRVSLQNNEVISSSDRDLQKLLETIDINGDSQYYEISYRQPVIRSPKEELAFSVGLNYRNGQNFVSDQPVAFGCGVGNNGVCRTNVLLLGQDYTLRQETGAWAFRSQFRVGTGIFKVTQNPEPIPDGYFFSWLGQIQRVQLINDRNFLIIQGDIQLTPDALVPSEQFVIGGAQSVRGYRQNVRAGDNGFRISIEDRITIVRDKDTAIPVFQLAPFFDMGSIWNNPKNPNIEPDQTFVAGIGLGLIWQPVEEMNIRLDYGYPIIDLKDRGDNIQDDGLYFNIKYNF